MAKFYVEFDRKTLWAGYVDAESLDEASEIANCATEEDLSNWTKIQSALSARIVCGGECTGILDEVNEILN